MIGFRRRISPKSGYSIPDEYLELEGLQCTVGESYVRTNINLSANTIFEIEFVIQKKQSIPDVVYLFSQTGASYGELGYTNNTLMFNRQFVFALNKIYKIKVGTKNYFDNSTYNDSHIYEDNKLVYTGFRFNPYNLSGFAILCSGYYLDRNYSQYKGFDGILYKLKAEDYGNNASHVFVPCERLSDSICGLYDTYDGEFYEMSCTPIYIE